MSFFDEVAAVLTATGKQTVRTAKEASEIGKIRLQLVQEDRKLKNLLASFGLSCYAAMKNDNEKDLSEEIAAIDAQKAKMTQLKARLSELKKEKKCPHCGSVSAHDDLYCRRCGRAFEE